MAKWFLPYPYVEPARWGTDLRDPAYGADFRYLNSFNNPQKQNLENDTRIIQLNEYIEYLQSKEEELFNKLGIKYSGSDKKYNIFSSTNLKDIKTIEEKVRKKRTRYQNASNTFSQNLTKTLSSQKLLKNYTYSDFYQLFEGILTNSSNMGINAVINNILAPIRTELSRITKKSNATINADLAALDNETTIWQGYSKILAYIIAISKECSIDSALETELSVLEQKLQQLKLMPNIRNLIGTSQQSGKFILNNNLSNQTTTVEINAKELLKSIKGSLLSYSREDLPGQIEKALSKLGKSTGQKRFSGGNTQALVDIMDFQIPIIWENLTEEEEPLYLSQLNEFEKINKLLNDSIKRSRTVKTDFNLPGNFGVSVKVGQHGQGEREGIKLDTRKTFYNFINFISQYKEGQPIAQTLMEPENLHILINNLLKFGKFKSEVLDKALSIIAFIFFGATNKNYLILDVNTNKKQYNQYFQKDGTLKTNLNENIIMVDENGDITCISAYLIAIRDALVSGIKENNKKDVFQHTVFQYPKTNYISDPASLEHPHPSTGKNAKSAAEILQKTSVFTYIDSYW